MHINIATGLSRYELGKPGMGENQPTFIPIDSRSLSFTRPTPGILRIDRSCMNALIAVAVKSSTNWPFGLF